MLLAVLSRIIVPTEALLDGLAQPRMEAVAVADGGPLAAGEPRPHAVAVHEEQGVVRLGTGATEEFFQQLLCLLVAFLPFVAGSVQPARDAGEAVFLFPRELQSQLAWQCHR